MNYNYPVIKVVHPTSSSVSLGDVSHLDDEVGHDTVDGGVLVVEVVLEKQRLRYIPCVIMNRKTWMHCLKDSGCDFSTGRGQMPVEFRSGQWKVWCNSS